MNQERYHPELLNPEFQDLETPPTEFEDEPTNNNRRRKLFRKLGSYRVEIFFEIFLIIACTVLGVAFQFKMMLTISLFCLAAAIPDFVTAFLVQRSDPERKHGKALMYFFVAIGLTRTAAWGLSIFVVSMVLVIVLPMLGGLADVGAVTGLLVTMGVLVVVFPVTLMGVLHGRKLPGGVFFCREITKLRRRRQNTMQPEDDSLDIENLDPAVSLKLLASVSSISVAIFSVTTVFTVAGLLNFANRGRLAQFLAVGVVLSQLVVPIAWYIYFCFKFVEPWQPSENPDYVEPIQPGEIQFLNE